MDDLASHHFTVHRGPVIDAQIREDVTWLRDRILGEFPEAKALFLVGGFGRGEGGVVQRGGRWRPANDYDFEMITPRSTDHGRLKEFGETCAEHLGIPFVHIENSVAWKQRLRGSTEYTVDLKHGSLALHDPHDMRSRLRRVRADRIPNRDALWTLFTRASALLWRFEWGRDWESAPDNDRFDLANQISKALLAIEDAWLIRAHRYNPSYAERLRRFADLSAPESLLLRVNWATDIKLRPAEAEIPSDLHRLWFEVRDWHRAEVMRHAGVLTGEEVEDLPALVAAVRRAPLPLVQRIRMMRSGGREAWRRRVDLGLLLITVLSAVNPDGTVSDDLMESSRTTCAALGEHVDRDDWESLRRAVNSLFTKIW